MLHPSEILNCYVLSALIPFYPTILPSKQIRSLVLRILLLRVMKHISHMSPPTISSSPTHQCISNCFTLHPLPVKHQWDCTYQAELVTKVLMKRLSINVFFDESTILKILIVYRTAIARHLLGLLEGRLMYYEPIPTVTKHICHIIVPTSLHHIIFNLVYTTLVD